MSRRAPAESPRVRARAQVFGSIGGGTLTRENAASAMKVTSPALAAMERLKEVVDDAGKLAPAEEAELLSQTLDEAREAGGVRRAQRTAHRPPRPRLSSLVFALTLRASSPRGAPVSDTSPYYKRAAALLAAVENAARAVPREAEAEAADAVLDAKLDALFARDFPISSLELDDA